MVHNKLVVSVFALTWICFHLHHTSLHQSLSVDYNTFFIPALAQGCPKCVLLLWECHPLKVLSQNLQKLHMDFFGSIILFIPLLLRYFVTAKNANHNSNCFLPASALDKDCNLKILNHSVSQSLTNKINWSFLQESNQHLQRNSIKYPTTTQ